MPEIVTEPPREEYRYLHSTLQLELTLKDRLKILWGMNPLLGYCVRLVAYLDNDGKLEDIDLSHYSTKVLVKNIDEATPTSKAIFSYEKLHIKGDQG